MEIGHSRCLDYFHLFLTKKFVHIHVSGLNERIHLFFTINRML